jgi:D-inositol-3-phosphate glycosyltransferase
MISFVWSARYPFLAGAGGSESYTAGQIRELHRRGIPARIITIGHGEQDGREDFPDIQFLALEDKKQLEELDDTLVFITYPLDVRTKHQSYAVLHCPPPRYARNDSQYNLKAFKGKKLITASKFAAGLWRRHLHTISAKMPTVYPFASPAFAEVERSSKKSGAKTKILFAGRLTPDKGVYNLMASLHMDELKDVNYELAVTKSGSHTEEGEVLLKLVEAHPHIKVLEARKNAQNMAKLMAKYDVVVMPSTDIYWQELFGIVSIEAQHAGCRVVASRSGGLPETNVGGLMLVQPDNPKALAAGLAKAAELGPLTARERAKACKQFTLKQSVDSLLKAIKYDELDQQKTPLLREPRGLFPRQTQLLQISPLRSRQPAFAEPRVNDKYSRAARS